MTAPDGLRTVALSAEMLGMLRMIDYCVYFISSLPPKYLGHVEVEESRGMHVCEDAVKKLKAVSEGLDAGRGQEQTGRGDPDQAALFPALTPDGPEVREVCPVGVSRWTPSGGRQNQGRRAVFGVEGDLPVHHGMFLPRGPSRLGHVFLHQLG